MFVTKAIAVMPTLLVAQFLQLALGGAVPMGLAKEVSAGMGTVAVQILALTLVVLVVDATMRIVCPENVLMILAKAGYAVTEIAQALVSTIHA
jgi:hypothetical protein